MPTATATAEREITTSLRQARSAAAKGRPLGSIEDLLATELSSLQLGHHRYIRLLAQLASTKLSGAVRRELRLQMIAASMLAERLQDALQHQRPQTQMPESKAMLGLAKEVLDASRSADEISRDAKVVSALVRVAHVDIAAAGSAAAHAQLAGERLLAELLHDAVQEQERGVRRLMKLIVEDAGGASSRMGQTADFARQVQQFFERRISMPGYGRRNDEDDNRSSESRRGGGYSSRSRDDDDDRFGSEEGRSRSGRRSAEMQERDEYGQFAGYGGGGRSSRNDDDDDDRGSSRRSGGSYSSRQAGFGGRDDDDDRYSSRRGGGSSSRSRDDDDDRFGGEEGRSLGGRHSSHMQERDEYGQFAGYGGSRGGGRSSRDDDDDDDRGSSRRRSGGGGGYSSRSRDDDDDRGSSRRGGGGDYTDSAGRHYTRDSYERPGRALARRTTFARRRPVVAPRLIV